MPQSYYNRESAIFWKGAARLVCLFDTDIDLTGREYTGAYGANEMNVDKRCTYIFIHKIDKAVWMHLCAYMKVVTMYNIIQLLNSEKNF